MGFAFNHVIKSRLMVVSHTAKESRIYACAVIKNVTTVRIKTYYSESCSQGK